MGSQCIGKSKSHGDKQPKSSSNATSQQATPPKAYRASLRPSLKQLLSPYTASLYIPNTQFELPRQWQIHKQYRYQDYIEMRSISANNISKKNLIASEPASNERWSMCSSIDRLHWQRRGAKTAIINTNSYIQDADLQSQEKKLKQNNLNFKSIPNKILISTISLLEGDTYDAKGKVCEITSEEELEHLIDLQTEYRSSFKTVCLGHLKGVAYYEPQHSINQRHMILSLFGLNISTRKITIVLYSEQNNSFGLISSLSIKPNCYWELCLCFQLQKVSFESSYLLALEKTISPSLFKVYLAIQILKVFIDQSEKQILQQGLYLNDNKILLEWKQKIFGEFLYMKQTLWKKVLCLGKIYLQYIGIKNTDIFLEEMIQIVAFETMIVSQGLFCQFGIQINAKEHSFQNQSLYFLKKGLKKQQKHILTIKKHVLSTDADLICRLISSVQSWCSQGDHLTLEIVEKEYTNIMQQISQTFNHFTLQWLPNNSWLKDYEFRVHLLMFFAGFSKGIFPSDIWTQINDSFGSIKMLSLESAFLYLIFASLVETVKRGNNQENEEQKKCYLRALELGLKIYGDPRANTTGRTIQSSSIWFLYFLEHYCALFSKNPDQLEHNFLFSIAECLREDLQSLFPSEEHENKEQGLCSPDMLIKHIPIRRFSGSLICRQQIWDLQREASRSNYSQNASTSGFKRLYKSFYRTNQWEFSLKPQTTEGLLQWGYSKMSPPHPIPALKNTQILAISTSNYHVVFLTEQGLFGWGQNHSRQLGEHNQHKVYMSAVKIKDIKINRKNDVFELSCGNEHTALLLNRKLMMWGQSDGGIIAGNGYSFDSIRCGGLHTLGIRQGKVYSWGRGQGGQLGRSFTTLKQQKRQQTTIYYLDEPTQIEGIEGTVTKMACGDAHSLVLTQQGKMWVFGFSYQGQLGLGITGQSEQFQVFEPTPLNTIKQPILDVWAGPTSSFFKTNKGQVFSCGYNDCLQLGIDRVLKILQKKKYLHRVVDLNRKKMGEEEFSRPRKLQMFGQDTGLRLMSMNCGENHCLAMAQYDNSQKMLVGWGLNRHFQLDFKVGEVTAPRTLDVLNSAYVRLLCCGSSFSLAVIGKLEVTIGQARAYLLSLKRGHTSQ